MVDLYEFKIRLYYDYRDWSEIGTYALCPFSAEDAAAYADELARYDAIIEVRYNVHDHGTYHHVSVTDDEKIHPTVFDYGIYQNMVEIADDMTLLETEPLRFRALGNALAERLGISLR